MLYSINGYFKFIKLYKPCFSVWWIFKYKCCAKLKKYLQFKFYVFPLNKFGVNIFHSEIGRTVTCTCIYGASAASLILQTVSESKSIIQQVSLNIQYTCRSTLDAAPSMYAGHQSLKGFLVVLQIVYTIYRSDPLITL